MFDRFHKQKTKNSNETYITRDNHADPCARRHYTEQKANKSSTILEFNINRLGTDFESKEVQILMGLT